MRPKVALIDNSLDKNVYDPVRHWKAHLACEWISFEAKRSYFPALEEGFTHFILTGSEASILEREKWVYEEVELVKLAIEKGISILGSCYGHQLLVLALLGPAHVKRCENPEVGWIKIRIEKENDLLGEGRTAHCFSIHFDEVVNLNQNFEVLASTRNCPIQAFKLKDKPVWGIQMHPEIDIREGRSLLEKLLMLRHPNSPLIEKALNSKPRDSGLIKPILRKFLKIK